MNKILVVISIAAVCFGFWAWQGKTRAEKQLVKPTSEHVRGKTTSLGCLFQGKIFQTISRLLKTGLIELPVKPKPPQGQNS